MKIGNMNWKFMSDTPGGHVMNFSPELLNLTPIMANAKVIICMGVPL